MNKMPDTKISLRLESVEISLDDKVLISISDVVTSGEVLTIMGPSGSGKSTLLAFVGGFLSPSFKAKGNIFLNDVNFTSTPPEQRKMGILFQDALLFPHMSVGGNLIFAIPPEVRGYKNRSDLAHQALEEAGLGGFFHRDPATLSGGQKARVALMRVLLAQPLALLLDEPFSKLDTDRRDSIREFVFGEAINRNLPVMLVTHDKADADAAGGRVHIL